MWNWLKQWMRRDLDWREVVTSGGIVMRRRVNGVWETRQPSDEELHEAAYRQAIK